MMFGPLSSFIINRYGAHVSISLGTTLVIISLLVTSLMPRLEYLFLTFSLLFGLGTSLTYTPTMCMAADYFNKYLTVATGLMVAGSSVGTLLMSPITQYSIASMGWRNSMRLHAGLMLLVYGTAYVFKPERVVQQTPGTIKMPIVRRLVKDLQLWKDKVFIIWVLALFCAMFGYYIPYVHLVSTYVYWLFYTA